MKLQDDITQRLADLRAGRLTDVEAAALRAEIAADPALDSWQRLDDAISDSFDDASPGAFGWARLARDIAAEERQGWRGWHLAASAVAASVAAVLVWQVAVTPLLAPDAGYRTATGTATGDLRVAFLPETTEAQMRATLAALGARIVDGPSALGLYTLDLPDGADAGDAAQTLQAARGVIESVSQP